MFVIYMHFNVLIIQNNSDQENPISRGLYQHIL